MISDFIMARPMTAESSGKSMGVTTNAFESYGMPQFALLSSDKLVAADIETSHELVAIEAMVEQALVSERQGTRTPVNMATQFLPSMTSGDASHSGEPFLSQDAPQGFATTMANHTIDMSGRLVKGNEAAVNPLVALASPQSSAVTPVASFANHGQGSTLSASVSDSGRVALPAAQIKGGGQTSEFMPLANMNLASNTSALPATGVTTLRSDPSLLPAMAEFRHGETSDIASQATQQVGRQGANVSQWGPVSVTPQANMAQQAHEMLTPMREQLRFQIDQRIKHAELRLDPPELGKVELNIRLDGDRLHIQMHAANPAVREALLVGLDRLRNDLTQDHGGQIDLDIGQSSSGDERQRQQHSAGIKSLGIGGHDVEPGKATEMPAQTQRHQLNLLA
jgi:flagellar hook-length control protein FliK